MFTEMTEPSQLVVANSLVGLTFVWSNQNFYNQYWSVSGILKIEKIFASSDMIWAVDWSGIGTASVHFVK